VSTVVVGTSRVAEACTDDDALGRAPARRPRFVAGIAGGGDRPRRAPSVTTQLDPAVDGPPIPRIDLGLDHGHGARRVSAEEIPAEVRAFVQGHIPTVGHMETLALLLEGGTATWTTAQVAGRLYVPVDQAEGFLAAVARSGLIERRGPDTWGQAPDGDPALLQAAARAVELYRERLVPMTELIHAGAGAARQISEAFRFRKG
jgi:hypothetical protein